MRGRCVSTQVCKYLSVRVCDHTRPTTRPVCNTAIGYILHGNSKYWSSRMKNWLGYFCTSIALFCFLCRPAMAAPSPRLHERFDRGWLFYRGDEPGASAVDFNATGWRQVDLPHDWSIEDLPESGSGLPSLSLVPGAWRFKTGDDPA